MDSFDAHRLNVLQKLDAIVGKDPTKWTTADFAYVYAHMTRRAQRAARQAMRRTALGLHPIMAGQVAVTFTELLNLPRLLRKPRRIGLKASYGNGGIGFGIDVQPT